VSSNFSRDIFSLPRAVWQSVDATTEGMIVAVFEAGNGISLGSMTPERISGLEINSRNFRVRLSDGRLAVLKSSTARGSMVARQIAEHLNRSGIPAPKPIPFSSEMYEVEQYGVVWSLSEFIDGDYFTGDGGELENAATLCNRLLGAMQHLSFGDAVSAWEGCNQVDGTKLFAEVGCRQAEWGHLLGVNSVLLENEWSSLLTFWENIWADPPATEWQGLMHFDLHPHNLLYRDGHVAAVLDLESFRSIPLGVAVGFAGLKLCRQAVAHHGSAINVGDVGARFANAFLAEAGSSPLSHLDLAKLAQLEVFRRITAILRLAFHEGNSQWNHVLPIQLNHLYEADALFAHRSTRRER